MAINYNPQIVTDGLVLCLDAANKDSYPGTGTTWYDISGNGYNGTLTNGPTFSSSNNGSIVFDGTNDYVVTGNVNLSTTNIVSVDCWIKIINYRQTVGSVNIVLELSSDFNSTDGGFLADFADDTAGSAYGGAGTYQVVLGVKGNVNYNMNYWTKTLVNDLNWHHWCCIFDKSQSIQESYLYIDGIFRTGTITTFNANNTNNFGNLPFYIGGRGATFNSNIQVGNVNIYNRLLSSSEVFKNYSSTRGRFA